MSNNTSTQAGYYKSDKKNWAYTAASNTSVDSVLWPCIKHRLSRSCQIQGQGQLGQFSDTTLVHTFALICDCPNHTTIFRRYRKDEENLLERDNFSLQGMQRSKEGSKNRRTLQLRGKCLTKTSKSYTSR